MGAGTTRNYYDYDGIVAGLFKRPATTWANLADPTSDIFNNQGGSVWPLVGQAYLLARDLPPGFVTTGVGASTSASWLPGQANYDAMIARATLATATGGAGTIKAVLWWQGESDAIAGVSQATYHANLSTIAAGIETDLGVPLIVAKLHGCSTCGGALAGIQAAQEAAWSDVTNVLAGPDLSDIDSDDGLHLVSNAKIQEAATRWWAAIEAALYP
jgi:hypothetical protein